MTMFCDFMLTHPEFLRGCKFATEQIPELQERFIWTQWVASTSLFLFVGEGVTLLPPKPTLMKKATDCIQPTTYHAESSVVNDEMSRCVSYV